MNISIITPEHVLFKGECKLLQLPGLDGSFEILENHAPIITMLGAGKIKMRDKSNHDTFFDIIGGVLHVKENHVTVLAEEMKNEK